VYAVLVFMERKELRETNPLKKWADRWWHRGKRYGMCHPFIHSKTTLYVYIHTLLRLRPANFFIFLELTLGRGWLRPFPLL
jgi:hypothetical protein